VLPKPAELRIRFQPSQQIVHDRDNGSVPAKTGVERIRHILPPLLELLG
jgi:hypothetical protein